MLSGETLLSTTVDTGCGSDLMSDVLAFVHDGAVLITGLINPHVIRTSEMLDIRCVVFSRGKKPPEEILDMAKECSICVLSTQMTTFSACGVLYANGLSGGDARRFHQSENA